MPPFSAQNMPSPVEHFGKSRLLAVIIGLIALCFILVAVFVYIQSGQKMQKPVASDSQELMRQQMISQLSGSTATVTPVQIERMKVQLSSAKTAITDEQRAVMMNQLQASH